MQLVSSTFNGNRTSFAATQSELEALQSVSKSSNPRDSCLIICSQTRAMMYGLAATYSIICKFLAIN